ncbi:hypothetical protein [Agarivorans sp. DSG3-1]|uniref:hypothetical protein n=1 Tax=Agarivorans sp. DSG3-1 TaxID=3342249 RepID=UPI00398E97C4
MLKVRRLIMVSILCLLIYCAFSLKIFDGKGEPLSEWVTVQQNQLAPVKLKPFNNTVVEAISLGATSSMGDAPQYQQSQNSGEDFAGQLAMQIGSAASKENFLRSMVLLEEWAKYDLIAVLEWLERQSSLEMGSFYQAIVLSAMLNPLADKQQLAELIAKLPEGLTNHSLLISTFANDLAEQNINLALEWLETVELQSSATHATTSVLTQWAQVQPNLALEFLLEQPELSSSLTHQMVINASSALNNDELTQQIEQLYRYPEDLQLSISGALVRAMLARQPTQAKQWIEEQVRGPIKDASLREYIQHQADYIEPHALRALILEVEDNDLFETLWVLVANK